MSHYRRGRAFEYQVRDRLVTEGYWVCRAAGSKGCADLVACRRDGDLLVSCRREFQLDPLEWNTLFDLAIELDKTPILAVKGARGVLLFRLLARKTGKRGVRSPCCPWLAEDF